MQEDSEDGEGTDIAYQEEVGLEEATAERSPVGELIANQLLGHIPANEQAGEETTDGQEELSRHEVEEVEE